MATDPSTVDLHGSAWPQRCERPDNHDPLAIPTTRAQHQNYSPPGGQRKSPADPNPRYVAPEQA
jgi:hypothetical protein